MSEETSPVANSSEKPPSSVSVEYVPTLQDHAERILQVILRKHPDITVIISNREGKCLTSTLCKKKALESSSNILNFTDKAKVLTRKVLKEELSFVRIKGRTNEIVVTFDDLMEIITIQEDKTEMINETE